MSQNYTYPPGFSISTNASVGLNGASAPTSSTEVGGINPSNNLEALKVDASGNLLVNIQTTTTNPLPTTDLADGPVTPGTVATRSILIGGQYNTALPTLTDTQQSSLQVDSSGRAILSPLQSTSTVTVVQPTGTNLHAVIDSGTITVNQGTANVTPWNENISQFGGSSVTLGQKVSASSMPIVIASDQSTLNVLQPDVNTTGSITSTQSVTLSVNGLGTVGIQVSGTWTGTLFVEASVDGITFNSTTAITLATGAPTLVIAANGVFQMQAAGMNSVRIRGNSVGSGTADITLRGNASVSSVMLDNSLPTGSNVIGAVTQSGTWNINNISGTVSLPTGASTSANQTTGNSSLSTIATNTTGLNATITTTGSAVPADALQMGVKSGSNLIALTLGQTTMSASVPVAIASNQSAVPVSGSLSPNTGRSSANAPVYNVYSSVNITTGAYVQLVASTTSTTNYLDIFDSSGQGMILGVGGSGSEVVQAYIPPGGDQIQLAIPSGSRVAYKALTATANSGYLLMNFYT